LTLVMGHPGAGDLERLDEAGVLRLLMASPELRAEMQVRSSLVPRARRASAAPPCWRCQAGRRAGIIKLLVRTRVQHPPLLMVEVL